MEEVLILHEPQMNKAQRRERCIELLHAVGIPNPEERLKEYPNQFSGGMRQRVIIVAQEGSALLPSVSGWYKEDLKMS